MEDEGGAVEKQRERMYASSRARFAPMPGFSSGWGVRRGGFVWMMCGWWFGKLNAYLDWVW